MFLLLRSYLSGFACLALLGGVIVEKAMFHTPPADASAYHAAVRAAAETVPMRVGSWLGRDVPVPQGAVALLQPNVILSRRYQDIRTGRTVSFLLVQCRDARDLLGHYPPVCYRNMGWTQRDARPRTWTIDDLTIEGIEYDFVSAGLQGNSEITISNFMVLPNGTTCRDMDGVDRAAQNYRQKFHGAAQVQLVTDIGLPPAQRDEVLARLLRANRKLIDAIRFGVPAQ